MMAIVWDVTYSASASDLNRRANGRKGGPPPLAHMLDSIHMLRDGNSFNFVSSCVAREFTDCGIILNLPPGVYKKEGPDFGPLPPIKHDDLLVLATRPPIDDDEDDRRSISESASEIEEAIFKELKKVFEYCSRKTVLLSEAFMEDLDASSRKYATVQFNVNKNAYWNRHSSIRSGDRWKRFHKLGKLQAAANPRKTLGYLVYIPEIPFGENPSLLTSFGMNGTSNLLWNFAVKTHFCDEVRTIIRAGRPHILVGEFSLNLSNDQRPTYISPDLVSIPEKVIDMDFELG